MKRSRFVALAVAAPLIQRPVRAADVNVSVAYAGSLTVPMEKSIGPAFSATGYRFAGEGKGSTTIANFMLAGLRTPDVFISADTAAIDLLRGSAGHDTTRWYATFAATRMQIAFSRSSKHAADFAAAAAGTKRWFDVLRLPGVVVARTDPAADPKGYRVLLVMRLAESYYKLPGLADSILGDERNPQQMIPEEDALARLDTGEVDAIWSYSTESSSRGLPAIELPAEINLGDPNFAQQYGSASVTIGPKTYRGSPIVYALTIPTTAGNPTGGAAFVKFLLGSRGHALLIAAGLTILEPRVTGDRSAIEPSLRASFP